MKITESDLTRIIKRVIIEKRSDDESFNERKSYLLDELINEFLDEGYYPDYGWEPDFYRNEIKQSDTITFYINDKEGYYYYADDGTLLVNPWVCKSLDIWFNDGWKIPFKKWFEKNSGLEISAMVTNGRWVNFN